MESYIGLIHPTAYMSNFNLYRCAPCLGQPISLSTAPYQALFSLIGPSYGGDGRVNFGLPDLRGRTAVGSGSGPGLSVRQVGQKFGQEFHTLAQLELPVMKGYVSIPELSVPIEANIIQSGTASVAVQAAKQSGNKPTQAGPSMQAPADGSYLAYGSSGSAVDKSYFEGTPDNGTFTLGGVSVSLPEMAVSGEATIPQQNNVPVAIPGGNRSFPLLQPSLVLNYQIVLDGIYPTRS